LFNPAYLAQVLVCFYFIWLRYADLAAVEPRSLDLLYTLRPFTWE